MIDQKLESGGQGGPLPIYLKRSSSEEVSKGNKAGLYLLLAVLVGGGAFLIGKAS